MMLPTYRKILFATDLSSKSVHAFRHALSLAQATGADLHVLHVMPEMETPVVNYIASVIGEERFTEMELQHEQELQENLTKDFREYVEDEGVSASPVAGVTVRHGSPAIEIVRYAEELSADLVVLGSHGKGALHYAFIGSVARKVLEGCQRPVMTVRLTE